jgi:hypothetical protein
MPLRDHFRLPLRSQCTWDSFHSGWTNEIMRDLNKSLPLGYVARPHVKLGVDVEADVGTLETGRLGSEGNGGVATALWAPPQPTQTVAVDFHHLDVFEVQVHREGGLELVAAIELVSPRNKDRPSARRSFVAKCVAYLQAGVSVVVVDVVSARGNFYALVLEELSLSTAGTAPDDLYAVACRAVPPEEPSRLETWVAPLAVGSALPTLPLWLEDELAWPLNLERAYESTFVEMRVPVES